MGTEKQTGKRLGAGVFTAGLWCVVVLFLLPGVSRVSAGISLDLVSVDNSAFLSGYRTFDIKVTTDTDWTVAAMLLELDAGSIYQHGMGADTGPFNSSLSAAMPGLAFDTYVTGTIAGGAGDIDPESGFMFGTEGLGVSWFNVGTTDIGETTIGRLTMTDDAAGRMSMLVSAAGGLIAEFEVGLTSGAMPDITQIVEAVEPEPEPEPELPVYTPRDPNFAYGVYYPEFWLAPSEPLPAWRTPFSYDTSLFRVPTIPAGSRVYDDTALAFNSLRYADAKADILWERGRYPDRPSSRLNTFSYNPTFTGPLPTDSTTPEPVSAALFGLGMGVLVMHRSGIGRVVSD